MVVEGWMWVEWGNEFLPKYHVEYQFVTIWRAYRPLA
jgi:hypothetical protein